MIELICHSDDCRYEAINLCKQFFPGQTVSQTKSGDIGVEVIILSRTSREAVILVRIRAQKGIFEGRGSAVHSFYLGAPDLDLALGKAFFQAAVPLTGYHPPWGILTGVRPVKLMKGLIREHGVEKTCRLFAEEFFVIPQKIQICLQSALCEMDYLPQPGENDCSLYVSIPFCPTRCAYCSFVSQENDRVGSRLVDEYLALLCREIALTGELIDQQGQRLKTVYIGGGTPAVLSPPQIKSLLRSVEQLGLNLEEYTFEAGRPDVITAEKLETVRSFGVNRISINPQTLDDRVLELIGRRHTVAEFYSAYELASSMGFDNINTDLISGLPGDTTQGFCRSMDQILKLAPAGITIHSFYRKRSSQMGVSGSAEKWIAAGRTEGADYAYQELFKQNYQPYYLYRQKDTAGGSENIGWGRNHRIGYYNIYMMNELHTVYACGAGGVSRLMRSDGAIHRIYNLKLPLEYIKHFTQIEERKRGVIDFYGGQHESELCDS